MTIDVVYLPSFVHQYKNLEKGLQEEVLEKIEEFRNPSNHSRLKVHKLHGKLKNRWSFSVSYNIRIVFSYISKKEVAFLAIGDHSLYQ